MTIRLYLDDCAYSRILRSLLEKADYSVQIPAETSPPLTGASDDSHFAHAINANRVIITYNARDFLALHNENRAHPGIFAIYQDNDPSRDMSYHDIVKAIGNLRRTNVEITSGFWILNVYRW